MYGENNLPKDFEYTNQEKKEMNNAIDYMSNRYFEILKSRDRKIVDYKIVIPEGEDDGKEKFERYQKSILDNIKNGWIPLGGISVGSYDKNNSVRFFQSMIKYED